MQKSQPFRRSHQGYGLDAPLLSLSLPHGILWFPSPPNHPQLRCIFNCSHSWGGSQQIYVRTRDSGTGDPSALTLRIPTACTHTRSRTRKVLIPARLKDLSNKAFLLTLSPPLTVTIALLSAFELGVPKSFITTFLSFITLLTS